MNDWIIIMVMGEKLLHRKREGDVNECGNYCSRFRITIGTNRQY